MDLEGVDDRFDRAAIRVTDSCRGRSVTRRVAGPQDNPLFSYLSERPTPAPRGATREVSFFGVRL